jgi:hypothetical protein
MTFTRHAHAGANSDALRGRVGRACPFARVLSLTIGSLAVAFTVLAPATHKSTSF